MSVTDSAGRLTTRLTVRLTPRSSRDEVISYTDEVLHVRVTAPPVEGAANEALVALLAKRLGVPRTMVTITHGEASRLKVVQIDGMDRTAVVARLLASASPH